MPVTVGHWDPPVCANCISQPGTTRGLIAGAGVLNHRLAYRNLGDHEALVVSHSVDAGNGTIGVRWYELRPDGHGSLAVFQQGTFAPDGTHRWMGSVAMDKYGNLAVGYSASSDTVFPSIRYAARLAGDPPGLLALGESTLFEGQASQTWSSRWGDYSSMQVDPVDDCTFWYTNEYAGRTVPGTRISAFRLPGCGDANDFSLVVSPASQQVHAGSTVDYVVQTGIAAGIAENVRLSISGLPAGASGTFNPDSVPAGTAATLTVSAINSATASQPTAFRVTGVSASAVHDAIAQINISAALQDAGSSAGDGGDGGSADSGPVDGGQPDGSAPDAGPPDAGGSGHAISDGPSQPALSGRSGCGCGTSVNALDVCGVALLAVRMLRRRRVGPTPARGHRLRPTPPLRAPPQSPPTWSARPSR